MAEKKKSIKVTLEKVYTTVNTFLKKETVKVSGNQTDPEKVTNMVGTFLKSDSSAAMVSKYQPLKWN